VLQWWRRWRRDKIRRHPFPAEWNAILDKNVPYVARLPLADQDELRGAILIFLAEKNFEGCGGLELTDEVRVTIAAQACVLLLHRETDYYHQLVSVLVYPSTYLAPGGRDAAGLVSDEPQARLGESWKRDIVVLAWDSVLSGAHDLHPGHNVVFHEFAHQLDQESGDGDGVPSLPRRSMYAAWARVLGHEFEQLVRNKAQHHRTDIDQYGAKNPAEFFAVVTEAFFETPRRLRAKHPALYAELQAFYQQDPALLPRAGQPREQTS